MAAKEAAQRAPEDAAKLQLGDDFSAREPDAVQFLWNSEAKFILEAHVKEMGGAPTRPEVVDATMEYLRRVNNLTSVPTVNSARTFMEAYRDRLHPFQIATLVNLDVAEVEEARALVPKLGDVEDAEIEYLVEGFRRIRSAT